MDKGRELKVNDLVRVVALHRERRRGAGKRLRWPVEIRRNAAGLLVEGVSIDRLSQAMGISRETLRIWRMRSRNNIGGHAGFSELRVVAVSDDQSCNQLNSSSNEIVLRGLRGHLITGLQIQHIAALLQAGFL